MNRSMLNPTVHQMVTNAVVGMAGTAARNQLIFVRKMMLTIP